MQFQDFAKIIPKNLLIVNRNRKFIDRWTQTIFLSKLYKFLFFTTISLKFCKHSPINSKSSSSAQFLCCESPRISKISAINFSIRCESTQFFMSRTSWEKIFWKKNQYFFRLKRKKFSLFAKPNEVFQVRRRFEFFCINFRQFLRRIVD